MHRFSDSAVSVDALPNSGSDDIAFSESGQDRHTKVMMSELNGWPAFPLAMLHPRCYHHQRTVRGQSYWLSLLCRTLSFPIPSRFYPGAFPDTFSFLWGVCRMDSLGLKSDDN